MQCMFMYTVEMIRNTFSPIQQETIAMMQDIYKENFKTAFNYRSLKLKLKCIYLNFTLIASLVTVFITFTIVSV